MSGIPSRCPNCGSSSKWKERADPFRGGIPVGRHIRIRLISVRGLFAEPVKKALGFDEVKYRCGACGYEQICRRR